MYLFSSYTIRSVCASEMCGCCMQKGETGGVWSYTCLISHIIKTMHQLFLVAVNHSVFFPHNEANILTVFLAVLATLFLLSYAKLLRTIIAVFTFLMRYVLLCGSTMGTSGIFMASTFWSSFFPTPCSSLWHSRSNYKSFRFQSSCCSGYPFPPFLCKTFTYHAVL